MLLMLPRQSHPRVEYNSRSSVIDRPTGVHGQADKIFALIGHTYTIGQGLSSYCKDGKESMSDSKVQTTDGSSRQDLKEFMISRCLSAK